MADGIKFLKFLPRLLLAASLAATTGLVLGEEVKSASSADPTRPPAAMLDPSPSNAAEVSSGLQTVIVRKKGRSLAVINGQTVELGGKVGDARLVKINESQVELQGPGGKEIMRLTPTVDIKPHKPQVQHKAKAKAKAANAHKRGGGKAKRAPSKSKSNHQR